MEPLGRVDAAPLLRPLLAELLALLRGLPPEDWARPTVAGAWRVRDVAAHLLDGDLRRVAVSRDGHLPSAGPPPRDDRELAALVNGLNAQGVAFAARLSPRLLVDLLEVAGGWAAETLEALAPEGPAVFPVSWAGETASANWMDVGREYTERWHHQQQIRDAVGAPRLLAPRWLTPLLELSARALPVAFRGTEAPAGAAVTLAVHGETAGAWTVVREADGWAVRRGRPAAPDAEAAVAADDAWRLLFHALPPAEAARRVRLRGDARLAAPLLRARSVIV